MNKYNIKIDQMNVGITEWGCSNNKTVICIHGLGSSSLSFIELGQMLQDKYHFISIDLPGHGRTDVFSDGSEYEIPNLVQWVDNCILKLGYNEFYILAHSWGGEIALHYAAKYSEKVKKILLIDGGYQIKSMYYEYMHTTFETDTAYYEKDFNGYVFSNWDDFFKTEERAYLRYSEALKIASMDLMKQDNDKIRFIASGAVARAALTSMCNSPVSLVFSKLPDNILLLQSTLPESWLEYRQYAAGFFRKNTKAVVKPITNTTHMIHWDNPDAVADELIKFFK